jgi:hypothetical protein
MLAQLSAYLIFGEIANPVCSSEFFYENYTAGATSLLAARQLPNFLPTEAMVILTFFCLATWQVTIHRRQKKSRLLAFIYEIYNACTIPR